MFGYLNETLSFSILRAFYVVRTLSFLSHTVLFPSYFDTPAATLDQECHDKPQKEDEEPVKKEVNRQLYVRPCIRRGGKITLTETVLQSGSKIRFACPIYDALVFVADVTELSKAFKSKEGRREVCHQGNPEDARQFVGNEAGHHDSEVSR